MRLAPSPRVIGRPYLPFANADIQARQAGGLAEGFCERRGFSSAGGEAAPDGRAAGIGESGSSPYRGAAPGTTGARNGLGKPAVPRSGAFAWQYAAAS